MLPLGGAGGTPLTVVLSDLPVSSRSSSHQHGARTQHRHQRTPPLVCYGEDDTRRRWKTTGLASCCVARTCRTLGRGTRTYLSRRDVPLCRLETSVLSHPTPRLHHAPASHHTLRSLCTAAAAASAFDQGRDAQARAVTSRPGQPPTPTPQQVPQHTSTRRASLRLLTRSRTRINSDCVPNRTQTSPPHEIHHGCHKSRALRRLEGTTKVNPFDSF